EIHDDAPFDANNPHYLRLKSSGTAPVGVANEGFRGIGVKAGDTYDFSVRIRSGEGKPSLRIEITDGKGKTLASASISNLKSQWEKRAVTLKPNASEPKAELRLSVEGAGARGVDVDMVSLFPQKTWK